ncbi:glycosyltransferase family 4 protein [Marinicella sp. W31]|uniref:glycosyltransferase family 4 protein n=1 Tax=Marinicella sp. W31 TaxID=3023713 RepID=UPI0037568A62
MKIILNADAITHPLTGIGRYTLELAQAFQKLEAVQTLKLFSGNQWIPEPQQALAANQWLATARRIVPFKGLALRLYSQRRKQNFIKLCTDLQDHVLHSPNFLLLPFTGPSVVTIHDLSFIHHAESQPVYRIRFLQQQLPKTLEQADAIITPTDFIRQELITHYGLNADQVHAIPMGVGAQFHPRSEKQHQDVLNSLNLPKDFVLSVATKEPRKNLQALIQAHAQLPIEVRKNYPLVLTGGKGWLDKSLNQDIQKALNQGHIYVTGYVSEEQLATLYSAATLLAFPSVYEGFGLPILEAMRSGTAVLTSQDSAMSEVADGRAVLCNPHDIGNISEQMQYGISSASKDQKILKSNAEFAAQFSWQACALKTLKVYQSIVNS